MTSDVKSLIDTFVANSSDFYGDLEKAKFDEKHRQIVEAAYEDFSDP